MIHEVSHFESHLFCEWSNLIEDEFGTGFEVRIHAEDLSVALIKTALLNHINYVV